MSRVYKLCNLLANLYSSNFVILFLKELASEIIAYNTWIDYGRRACYFVNCYLLGSLTYLWFGVSLGYLLSSVKAKQGLQRNRCRSRSPFLHGLLEKCNTGVPLSPEWQTNPASRSWVSWLESALKTLLPPPPANVGLPEWQWVLTSLCITFERWLGKGVWIGQPD